ncbi:hypothetical protein Ahy_A08g040756 isoform B [Arachis hypogaea]|uniref:Uncharacterized protein n=1 Tax=Arachis hypogaea TaxID=3818 RepID=A0A445C0K8_ARAHY|nr:hypothetical protein Ahy_A08g040756 isoform B [Arachis hypogaea]
MAMPRWKVSYARLAIVAMVAPNSGVNRPGEIQIWCSISSVDGNKPLYAHCPTLQVILEPPYRYHLRYNPIQALNWSTVRI